MMALTTPMVLRRSVSEIQSEGVGGADLERRNNRVVDLYRADGRWLDWFDISGDGFAPGLNP